MSNKSHKKEESFQCAHIDATAKGKGKTAKEEIWNMVPSCAKCNLTCNTKFDRFLWTIQ